MAAPIPRRKGALRDGGMGGHEVESTCGKIKNKFTQSFWQFLKRAPYSRLRGSGEKT
jgi:hypothetical protein